MTPPTLGVIIAHNLTCFASKVRVIAWKVPAPCPTQDSYAGSLVQAPDAPLSHHYSLPCPNRSRARSADVPNDTVRGTSRAGGYTCFRSSLDRRISFEDIFSLEYRAPHPEGRWVHY